MPKPTLFVCQSCHSSEERPEHQPADGTRLLNQLNALRTESFQSNELVIQPVSCLWTCDKPCAVAFSAPHKPTYLFTNLPVNENGTAAALLEFGKLYHDRKTGNVPWQQFPKALQEVSIVKIPAVSR
jgi:predicted metal-binding protein